jgi:sporulation protein YlmC with PRC-barrel domain
MSTMEAEHPLIAIGAEVDGTGGKLGEVSRVVVDPEHDRISAVVVKRGRLLATERVVPLACFMAGDGAALHLNMDEEEFEGLDPFDETVYRAPDPDYSGPPGFDRASVGMGNMSLNTYVALGPQLAFGSSQPVGGFPGGEPIRPVIETPTLEEGADVFDVSGDKVGEVAQLVVDPDGGAPVRLTVKQGFLFKAEYDVPMDWIAEIGDGSVHLNVTKADIEDGPAV